MESMYLKTGILILAASLGYSGATIGMKMASGAWSATAVLFLLSGFLAATFAEIILMRGINLGALYLIIIAVETLIVLAYAFSIGEGLTTQQIVGAGFVLVGLAIVSVDG
ncbi:MAG TPA: 5-aminolevulinate synthase [Rhodobacteraceae bacterium]|nr:5-aminolevulinate synthase [Paracoccaceae bacterium]